MTNQMGPRKCTNRAQYRLIRKGKHPVTHLCIKCFEHAKSLDDYLGGYILANGKRPCSYFNPLNVTPNERRTYETLAK